MTRKKILVYCCILGIVLGFAGRIFLQGQESRYALGVCITIGFAVGYILDLVLNPKERK